MRVLLDTQVVYIASGASESRLSEKVRKLLLDPDNERLMSAATLLEIAVKNAKGFLAMTREQTVQATADLRLTVLPLYPAHAYRFFDLPWHHKDPFDRMLIATALHENVPILSADREFKRYKGLTVIW